MAARPRNLFLYLSLACFLGLVAIFVVDGYMGVYDTIYITAEGQEQKIEADFWSQEYNVWSMGAIYGETVSFRYEVDNRRFSTYSADIDVSLWRSQQRVASLASQQIQISPFDKGQIEWVLDTSELEAPSEEQDYQYTLIIKRGELERRLILFLNRSSSPQIAVPAK